MKNTHTPGPWKIRYEKSGRTIDAVIVMGKSSAYFTRGIGQTFDEQQSNARLIAAAPELLTALEWALDQLDDDLDPDYQAAFDAARATVKKATGIQ
jgi:hypothetical protein